MGKPELYLSVILTHFLLVQFITIANPQRAFRNGNQPYMDNYCGDCPNGTEREVNSAFYGYGQQCATGYYMRNGDCVPCPCPGTHGHKKFGTSCRLDVDGQVTCDCPSEYTGRDCSQCAPGALQNNQYPYNCIRLNKTISITPACAFLKLCSQKDNNSGNIETKPEDSCEIGEYKINGQCSPCPCPGTLGYNKFGTWCRLNVDGYVTCHCPGEYVGQHCNKCEPGEVQETFPLYKCIRIHTTVLPDDVTKMKGNYEDVAFGSKCTTMDAFHYITIILVSSSSIILLILLCLVLRNKNMLRRNVCRSENPVNGTKFELQSLQSSAPLKNV